MMENTNEMMNMELANEATTDLVETAVDSGSMGIGGLILRTALTIGAWECGKRLSKWAVKATAKAIKNAEENKRIKQAKKIDGEDVIVTDDTDVEKTYPIE